MRNTLGPNRLAGRLPSWMRRLMVFSDRPVISATWGALRSSGRSMVLVLACRLGVDGVFMLQTVAAVTNALGTKDVAPQAINHVSYTARV